MRFTFSILTIFTLLFAFLLLVSYFTIESLFEQIWFFAYVPVFIFGIALLVFFILEIFKKNLFGILICVLSFMSISWMELLKTELFKGEIILQAELEDDLCREKLIFRDDKRFEIVSTTLFSEETFEGNYKMQGNQIILKDKNKEHDFLPDTLQIINDTIYLKYDSLGKPVAHFASYFVLMR